MDFTKSKIAIAVATAATLTGCGGGGGGGGIKDPVYGRANGIHDPWVVVSTEDTTENDTETLDCANVTFKQDVWWEETIDGRRTGKKLDLVRTDTKVEKVCVQITRPEPVIEWGNGVYDPWTLTSSVDTTVNDTTTLDCRNDNYERNIWWEKIVDGVRTGERGALIHVESKTEEVCVNTSIVRTEDSTSTSTTTSPGSPTTTTTYEDRTVTSTDADGNTVTEVYRDYTDTTVTPVTTTTVTTVTRTTYYSNGTSSSEVTDTSTTQETENVSTISSRSERISRSVAANLVSSTLSSSDVTTTTNGTPTSETTSSDETRTGTDANGSTVTETWRVYTTTVTTPVTTTVTTTVTRVDTYSDGTIESEVVSVTPVSTTVNTTSTSTAEELLSSTTTPNVVSTSTSSTDAVTVTNGTAITATTYVDDVRTSLDANGSTVTETWRVYTDTTTTPVTTTTVTTTVRTTVYTDGTTVTEPVSVTSNDAVTETVSTSTREELQSRTVTPNVAGTADTTSDETTSVTGAATVTTTYVDDVRTSLDANGSTVTATWRVYTDTTTTPVTTTVTTTTTRTTTYTDGTTSAEVIDVRSTSSTSNTITTSTREELLSQTVTPNVASVADSTSSESTTTTGSPVLDNTIVNTDTRDDGVWYFYYDNWTVTTTTVTTTTTTRTTTYTDGTTATEVIDVTTDTAIDNVDTYTTVRYTSPDKPLLSDPLPPDDIDGSAVIGTWTGEGRTLDYDPETYTASTYYNSPYMGTPTEVESHDPADFATLEADNGQLLETRANYAYARGWTGLGSTVLILDTGIDTDHPELADKIKYQWEPGYDTGLEDTNGHGTHVAGIVAAAKDGTGMHGVAYDAELAVARIGERSPSMSFARDALTWAKQYDDIVAANISANVVYSTDYKNSIVDHGDGIYTNTHATYGGANYYNLENPADWGTALANSEIVLTVSAGNSGLDYVQNPATFASAVDADGNLLLDGRMLVVGNWNTGTGLIEGNKAGHVCKDYTTQCNDPYLTKDFYILAPGMRVYSTYLNGEYKNMSGTSMAAPAVAGAVAIVHQLWPYMKGSNIAQLLLQTADKDLPNYDENVHGQGLLDLDTATRPVGDLGISLTGRTGTTVELSGTLSVNGVDAAALSSVSAVDDYDRDFTVDLSAAQAERKISVEYADRQKNNGGWASTMANVSARKIDNVRFAASDNVEEYSVGYEHRFFDTNLTAGVSYTKADTNPWIDMSGMWGEVDGSQTTELNLTYDYKDMWAQVGAMNTSTRYKTGLVTDVDDIQSVYATVGYDADAIAVFGGIKPYAVNGSVTLRLPTSVDADGVMHYDTVSSRVRSELDGYVGFKHNYQKKNHSTTFVGIVDGGGEGHLNFNYRYKF